jgi:NTP pyrophosphatase (non-canonical NTP hydrolase)
MANPEIENYVLPDIGFRQLRKVNIMRCTRWHGPDSERWSLADWSNAMCGEAGETANVIKKIRRQETGAVNVGDPPMVELKKKAMEEIADVVIYCDLLAQELGGDLADAVREKFNKVSVKYGFPERL